MTKRRGNGRNAQFTRGSTVTTLQVRLSPEEFEKLQERAQGEDRTPSGQVRYLVRKWLAATEPVRETVQVL